MIKKQPIHLNPIKEGERLNRKVGELSHKVSRSPKLKLLQVKLKRKITNTESIFHILEKQIKI